MKFLWVSYFLQFWESHLHKERERDTCYVRCARRLLVLLLHAKIILSWETNVHESQSTTKLIVWGAQSVLRRWRQTLDLIYSFCIHCEFLLFINYDRFLVVVVSFYRITWYIPNIYGIYWVDWWMDDVIHLVDQIISPCHEGGSDLY